MTVPRSLRSDAPAQHAKQAFIQLLGEAASAQDSTNKSFIAFFEDRADAINSDIWRSLGQRLHMQSMIGHSCQLEHDTRDFSRNYRKQPFFIITNKNALAYQFRNLLCDGTHPHTNQEVRPKFSLCSWPAGLQQKIDMGILDLIGEGKRYMLAVGTGPASGSDSCDRGQLSNGDPSGSNGTCNP